MEAPAQDDGRIDIVKLLLKNSEDTPADTRHLDRFAKELGEDLLERLRDRLYHKLDLTVDDIESGRYPEFVKTSRSTDFAAVVKDDTEKTQVMIQFGDQIIALLAPLYFGGDPEKPVAGKGADLTEAEIGILALFAKLAMRGISKITGAKPVDIEIVRMGDIDRDKLPAFGGAIAKFSVSAGENQQFFTAIVPEHALGEATERNNMATNAAGKAPNQEIVQTRVKATVQIQAQTTTLRVLRSLSPGDWLPLENTSLEASLLVRDRKVVSGQIGRTGDIYSFKAEGPVSADKGLAANSDSPL